LALGGDQHLLDRVEAVSNDPTREAETFTIWSELLKLSFAELLEDTGRYRTLYLRKFESMSGVANLWRIQNTYEDILCASLARDFGMNADGVGLPRLVAGMLTAGNAAVIRRFTEQESDLLSETLETISMVEDLFSHLIVDQAKSA